VLNDAVVVGAAPGSLTPGGLHEVYGVAGFMFPAASTWWFGWFDRRWCETRGRESSEAVQLIMLSPPRHPTDRTAYTVRV
jgi:hypothetical protein